MGVIRALQSYWYHYCLCMTDEQKNSKNGEKSIQIKRMAGLDFGQLPQRRWRASWTPFVLGHSTGQRQDPVDSIMWLNASLRVDSQWPRTWDCIERVKYLQQTDWKQQVPGSGQQSAVSWASRIHWDTLSLPSPSFSLMVLDFISCGISEMVSDRNLIKKQEQYKITAMYIRWINNWLIDRFWNSITRRKMITQYLNL